MLVKEKLAYPCMLDRRKVNNRAHSLNEEKEKEKEKKASLLCYSCSKLLNVTGGAVII